MPVIAKLVQADEDTVRDVIHRFTEIEEVLERFPTRVFLPSHGDRCLHCRYSVGDDTLWGDNRRKKGAANTLAALRSIRAARPDGAPIYVILDNLSAHKGEQVRRWAKKNAEKGIRWGGGPITAAA